MTNNLKAERTLTAEELQTIIDGCEKATPGDPATVKAMASMALQSLSTQQPMGEVTDEMVERASKAMDEKFSEAFLDVWPDWDGLARLALNAALHPNQESGE